MLAVLSKNFAEREKGSPVSHDIDCLLLKQSVNQTRQPGSNQGNLHSPCCCIAIVVQPCAEVFGAPAKDCTGETMIEIMAIASNFAQMIRNCQLSINSMYDSSFYRLLCSTCFFGRMVSSSKFTPSMRSLQQMQHVSFSPLISSNKSPEFYSDQPAGWSPQKIVNSKGIRTPKCQIQKLEARQLTYRKEVSDILGGSPQLVNG